MIANPTNLVQSQSQVTSQVPIISKFTRLGVLPSTKPSGVIYTKDDFESNSMEYILNDIRFKIFPDTSKEDLKRLFLSLSKVSIRDPSISRIFLEKLNSGSYETFAGYINNEITKTSDVFLPKIKPLFTLNFDKLFDIYLSIEDPELSVSVFRYILFLEFQNQELHDIFLEKVTQYNEKQYRDMLLGGTWNAFFI